MNQTLENMLRYVAAWHPTAWNTFLPLVKYAQNSLVSSSSGVSPFNGRYGLPTRLTNKRGRHQFHRSGLIYAVAALSIRLIGGKFLLLPAAQGNKFGR